MSAKRNLTVRLDDTTREILEHIAEREMRPLANQINFFLKQSIDTYFEKNKLHYHVHEDGSVSFPEDEFF
jgi:predicted transcriptional regulator